MTGLISNLLLLTVQCVLLDCTERALRSVYKPYGPKMCQQLCQNFTDTFNFVQDDLSCHRNSTNDSADSRKNNSENVREDFDSPEYEKRRWKALPDPTKNPACINAWCAPGLCLTNYSTCVGAKTINYDIVNRQQFEFHTKEKTWNNARRNCEKRGESLLKIANSRQLKFYTNVFHVLEFDLDDYSFHVSERCKSLKMTNNAWNVVKETCKKRNFYICVLKVKHG